MQKSSGCIGCPIWSDSNSAIKIAPNSVFHERTKHVENDHHFVHHHIKHGIIKLSYIPSTNQLPDFFTTSHPSPRFLQLVSKLSKLTFSHLKLEREQEKEKGEGGEDGETWVNSLGQVKPIDPNIKGQREFSIILYIEHIFLFRSQISSLIRFIDYKSNVNMESSVNQCPI